MSVVDLTRAYSFDCYGTLIEWESGIRLTLVKVPELVDVDLDDASPAGFLARREAIELQVEGEEYRPYDEVLALSLTRCATEFGLAVREGDAKRFSASLADWEPFPDASPFLKRLQSTGLPKAILSNVTRARLRGSVRKLGFRVRSAGDGGGCSQLQAGARPLAGGASGVGNRAAGAAAHCGVTHTRRDSGGAAGVPCVWVGARIYPAAVAPVMVVRDLEELGRRFGAGQLGPRPRLALLAQEEDVPEDEIVVVAEFEAGAGSGERDPGAAIPLPEDLTALDHLGGVGIAARARR